MQRQVIVTGMIRSCGRIGHSTAENKDEELLNTFKHIGCAGDVASEKDISKKDKGLVRLETKLQIRHIQSISQDM
ncbi:hypothetical protein TNCV_328881 [Trichonephila clavipes]|nr:hypothetical protein TNCV_328881 [Trichonephila clavipes]